MYVLLATEAFDDDGLPHTLEHLIFLGSEDYPYKGVLDLLANRNFADGTNAFTDTDNTVYTITTAGAEGFLNIMPIYVDHILYPTLEVSSYVKARCKVEGLQKIRETRRNYYLEYKSLNMLRLEDPLTASLRETTSL